MSANDALLSVLRTAVLVLVALGALTVVRTRDPLSQSIAFSFYALLLSVMFFVFQAPDVALSQIVVGVASPLMILLTLSRIRRNEQMRGKQKERSP